jgi:hypothetical protein
MHQRPVLTVSGHHVAFDLAEPEAPRLVLLCPLCHRETSVATRALATAPLVEYPCGHPPARLDRRGVDFLLGLLAEIQRTMAFLPSRPPADHLRFERTMR